MTFNVATMLQESAESTPDKPLILMDGVSLTYQQVDAFSGRFATGLLDSGLKPGDKVAVQLPNVPEFLFAYFGIMKAGLSMVPLNPLLKGPEVAYHLSDSEAKALITHQLFAGEAVAGASEVPGVSTYVVNLPGNQDEVEGTRPAAELLAGEDTGEVAATNADDTAVLLYTSGTTGKPKGAELTHFQLYMNCTVSGGLFGVRSDDVSLAVLPFFHVFGLSSVVNMAVRFGGTLSVVPRFEVGPVLDAMERDRVTVFSGVPTMYFALLEADIEGRDLSALRIGVSGGAAIPGEVLRAWEDKFGVTILEGYGLSETASTATFNRSAEERKVLSIGKRIWGVDVRIVDDQDERLPRGEEHVGEIVIRGHNVMKGYFNRPQETAEAFRGGWFHTGDLGYEDDEGYLFIVDRKKDMVIRGGYNVYPREVEEVLYAHPAVAEAAVIGRPDERLGEEVVAFVALKAGQSATSEEVAAFAKERLAAYKYPRAVTIVDSLPKGPTGKILKKELRS